jgi:acyl transferase domain-containing protein
VPPSALVGHSIGEYAAACVAGVMSMDDAARLVALRGRLMGALPRGGMLAVGVDQASAVSIAGDALDVAAINGSRQTVLSGEHRAVEAAAAEFARRDIRCTVLKTSHAFHSRMMDAIVPEFEREVARVALRGPEVPVVSTATGAWLSAAQATDPRYWATQLRQPVRFLDALATLWRAPDFAALELGPRATATALARGLASGESRLVVPSMADSAATEVASLLAAVGELWCAGQPVDLAPCISSTPPVWLPGYAFARDRHWIEPSERRATPSGDPSVSLTALLRAQTELLLRQVDVLLDGGHRGSRERGDR